jgi:hypothetical protein
MSFGASPPDRVGDDDFKLLGDHLDMEGALTVHILYFRI